MSQVRIITTDSSVEWDYELAQLPQQLQDIHFTARYHCMYQENGDGEARLFVYEDAADRYLLPFLIRPLPAHLKPSGYFDIESAYGYSGPISSSTDLAFLKSAERAFSDYCRAQNVITEFIRFHPLLSNHVLVTDESGVQCLHLRDYVVVDLQLTVEERWMNYSPQNRNKIRKAEKSGFTIVQDRTLDHFDTFVRIYLENMQQLNAAPQYYFSPSYFKALKKLVETDGVLLLAMRDNQTAGAAVFLGNGKWSHYFLSSVTPDGRGHGAGNLLLHEGLNWAAAKGFDAMHLGGGIAADSSDPLLVLKQNFSQQLVPFHIGKRILNQKIYDDVIQSWESYLPEAKGKFGAILQRYRWTKNDLPVVH